MAPILHEHNIPSDAADPSRTTRVAIVDPTPCWQYAVDGTPQRTPNYTGMIAAATCDGDRWTPRLIAQLRIPANVKPT